MSKTRVLILLAAALLQAGALRAAGTSSAAFLRIGWGARPAAMGDAFTAAADDADALYWNPAGLNYVPRLQETFGHNVWIDGINSEHLAFAFRRKPNVVLGAGISYVNVGDIERADKYGNALGYYGATDMALLFSYARRTRAGLNLGGNLKVIRERIETDSGQSFAADVGAIYEKSARLKFGVTLKNLGTGLTLGKGGTSCSLPMGLRAGAAWQYSRNLLLASEFSLPFDDSLTLHFGTEYLYPSKVKGASLMLRAGIKTGAMSYLGAMSAITLGFGVASGAVGVDYALAPYGDLGMVHRLSLKIKFDALAAASSNMIETEKGGKKVSRNAAEVYRETMGWFRAKAEAEKLGKAEQAEILKRIAEKFAPLGVDVSETGYGKAK